MNYSRTYTALAYDARDGYVLAFGGLGASGALGDTWKYSHGNWSILLTATAPAPRWGAAMTYDDALSSIVLFGGRNATSYFGDTWEFSGGIWTEVATSTAPSPRAFAGATFDSYLPDNYTVLFGGSNGTTTYNDTWTFANGTWSELSPGISPPAVSGASFVFDRHAELGVLFGGLLADGTFTSATWVYRSGNWTFQPEPSSPSPRAYAGIAYDRAVNVSAPILFGGVTASGDVGDTWEFAGRNWTVISASTAGLSPRSGTALAFDGLPADFYAVQWGGLAGSRPTQSTWKFAAGAWTEVAAGGSPPPLSGAALANVPIDSYSVMFGGLGPLGPTNATWVFAAGSWSLLCGACGPSPRFDAMATFDRALGAVVLFGGTDGPGHFFNDTWEFANGTWRNVTQGPAPPARDQAGFDFYPSPLNASVLFGGFNGSAYLSDTWEFGSAGWVPVTTGSAPAPRANMVMTDDAPDGYMLLFGGQNATTVFGDSWAFRGGPLQTWQQLSPTTAPSARSGAQARYDPYNGYVILTGGHNGSVFYNDTWEYLGGNWTSFAAPLTPPARADGMLGFDHFARYIVDYGGFNASGNLLSDTWLWVAFSASVTAYPDPADAGYPVAFGVSATAGVKPYTYAWTFGDGASSALPTPYHTYAAPGTFQASVTVTDSHLPNPDTTVSNLTVVVNPALSIETATGTPSVTTPLTPVLFAGTVRGGTGPYTYWWTFGDGGAGYGANVTHAYARAGNYTAELVVNDTAGATATRSLAIQVVSGLAATVSATPASADVGTSVVFDSSVSGGATPYSYAWEFGDGGVASGPSAVHAYAVPGTFLARFWANDSLGQSFEASVSVSVAPLPGAAATATPSIVDIGVPVSFVGTAENGTGPFSYAWNFGDGSASVDTPTATHAYGAPGSYPVTFEVNDSVGDRAEATVVVTVAASPTVSSFTVTPSSARAGVAVQFVATVVGGVGPYTFAYSGMPPGCPTGNASAFNCTPASVGSYEIQVTVRDRFGAAATAAVGLAVEPGARTGFLGLPGNDGYWLLIGIVAAGAALFLLILYVRLHPRAPRGVARTHERGSPTARPPPSR